MSGFSFEEITKAVEEAMFLRRERGRASALFSRALVICLLLIALCLVLMAMLSACTAQERQAAARYTLDTVENADDACRFWIEVRRDGGVDAKWDR